MNTLQKKLGEIAVDKKKVKSVIGKDSDLTRSDFEKYVKLKYNVKIYNSIYEYYSELYNKDISGEVDQYVDDLAMHIIETTHKVFRCKNSKIKDKRNNETMVFFSYKGNDVIDIFIERGRVLDDGDCFFLFRKNGEERSRNAIKQWYGESIKDAKKIVKKLL